MTRKVWLTLFVVLALLTLTAIISVQAAALMPKADQESANALENVAVQGAISTRFTYQGQLKFNQIPVNDTCNFRFVLFDAGLLRL